MGLGASFAGLATEALFAQRTRGLAFGASPETSSLLPEASQVTSVLEVFLCGGVSQYESFYCVPEHGALDGTHWHLFANSSELASSLDACGIVEPVLEPFAQDALGQMVHLGPFAAPLRRRPDLLQRLRICITRHDLAPHEAAIPLALSGRTLGNPAVAGLGAHVQRHFSETQSDALGPCAYVLLSSSLNSAFIDNLRTLMATGLHPARARPLGIQVDGAEQLTEQLARPAVGAQRAQVDALLSVYLDEYAARLTWPGGAMLRAPSFTNFATAAGAMSQVGAISEVFEPAFFVPRPGVSCTHEVAVDSVGMQFGLAARLLSHPTRPARYVCIVDGGFVPNSNGGGAYDSHSDNSWVQARNLTHTLGALTNIIQKPGESAADKIDLDKTLVVLTTEFGRTPHAEGTSGRNHWPYGYPQMLLGGPIAAPGVSGACGADARAVHAATPQESRIAALLALGIWPFSPEAFNVADVPGASNEEQAAARVLSSQLGLV
jgi:hypothetical protein